MSGIFYDNDKRRKSNVQPKKDESKISIELDTQLVNEISLLH